MHAIPGRPRAALADGFIWRPRWFLLNRFIAVAGVFAALAASRFVFHMESVHYPALLGLAFVLLLSNIGYAIYYRTGLPGGSGTRDRRLAGFTMVQINADLVILTLMLHFSGGATNPFVFYYFFHTMLASILLSKRLAYLEALTAAVLFCGMAMAEGTGLIRHYPLFSAELPGSPVFMTGICAALSSALLIAVYMASSIMDRLRAHQASLEQALEETARLETEKSHFLDVVAHDLKSPVASIETMITSMLAVYGGEIPPKARQVLERVPVRTGELLRFIRELLDYSRIERLDQAAFPMEPVSLDEVVRDAVEMHAAPARSRNISIAFDFAPVLPAVRGNRSLLGHVAANLVSNAVRYTPEGGSITVRLHPGDGVAELEVADTGIGIPEEDLPRIFTDFFRAGNARKFTSTGTGLGLSITRGIIERHGGSIGVTSRLGEGTVFTVRLPVAAGAPGAVAVPATFPG